LQMKQEANPEIGADKRTGPQRRRGGGTKVLFKGGAHEVRGAGQKTNIVGNKPRSKEHMNTIITKKYAGKVALVTDGSRGIGPPTVNSGETDSRAPSIKYQPRSKRSYFDVGVGSVC
jgi:hypothetical protein